MQKIISFTLTILFAGYLSIAQTPAVHLNSIGFLPKQNKTAVIPQESKTFKVIDAKPGKRFLQVEPRGRVFRKM